MRFLCLHGMCTNSDVLEFQFQGIRSKLDPSHEYVFLEGDVETKAAPGVEEFFPGPYYAYYTEYSRDQIECAYERVMNFIQSRGPFDGVIGFSQGGALAAAAMLQHAKLHPTAEPLFKLGIFLCSTLPFNFSVDAGSNDSSDGPAKKSSGVVNNINLHLKTVDDKPALRQYDIAIDDDRVTVPTVHVIGRKDEYIAQCESLTELCSVDGNANGNMTAVYHDLGHLVAREPTYVRKVAKVIEDKIAAVES